jgi:N-acetylneuraminic acid mutarotase
MKGSIYKDECGIYGVQGIPGPANTPGARASSAQWTGLDGKLWLFGGEGYDAPGDLGSLDDMWCFDPATSQWTWIKGNPKIYKKGGYGAEGVAGSANPTGVRYGAAAWTGKDGRFWLYSGGFVNDLWRFDPSTATWTWMGGENNQEINPGAISNSSTWTGKDGKLWLFGGNFNNDGTNLLNALWYYEPGTSAWTRVGGSLYPGAHL